MKHSDIPVTFEGLLDSLSVLGFYRYDSDEVAMKARASALATGYPFIETLIRGPYHADSEDLAEGGALACLRQVTPF